MVEHVLGNVQSERNSLVSGHVVMLERQALACGSMSEGYRLYLKLLSELLTMSKAVH